MAGSIGMKMTVGARIRANWQEVLRFLRKNSTLAVLILLWVGLTLASPHFLTTDNMLNILLQASNIGIMAWAATMVIVAAEIDLSIGSIEALAGSTAAVIMVTFKMPAVVAILGALAAGIASGAIAGFFTSKVGMPSFITTLGMLSIARGAALLVTGGRAVYGLSDMFKFIGQGKLWIIPFPIIISLVFFIITWAILKFTRFGMNIYAVGSNAEAARLSGISPAKIRLAVLTLSGAFAAVAGMIVASRLNSGQGTVGTTDNLDVIASVVIGGTSLFGGVGTVTGTLMGVLLVCSINNGLNLMGVSAYLQDVAIGMLILLAVLLDYLTKSRRKG